MPCHQKEKRERSDIHQADRSESDLPGPQAGVPRLEQGGQEADAFEINAGVVTGANTNVAASNAAVANLAGTDCRGKFIERSFMARY